MPFSQNPDSFAPLEIEAHDIKPEGEAGEWTVCGKNPYFALKAAKFPNGLCQLKYSSSPAKTAIWPRVEFVAEGERAWRGLQLPYSRRAHQVHFLDVPSDLSVLQLFPRAQRGSFIFKNPEVRHAGRAWLALHILRRQAGRRVLGLTGLTAKNAND